MWVYRHAIVINSTVKIPDLHIKLGVITVNKDWLQPGGDLVQYSSAFQFHTIHTNIAQNVISQFENILSTYRIDGAGYSANFELSAIPKEYGLQPNKYFISSYNIGPDDKIQYQKTRADDFPEGSNETEFPLYDADYRVYAIQYLAWIE